MIKFKKMEDKDKDVFKILFKFIFKAVVDTLLRTTLVWYTYNHCFINNKITYMQAMNLYLFVAMLLGWSIEGITRNKEK